MTTRTHCDAGCGARLPESAMWRITRRPDEPEEWLKVQLIGDPDADDVRLSGPEHMLICPECWQAARGFVTELRGTREQKVNR